MRPHHAGAPRPPGAEAPRPLRDTDLAATAPWAPREARALNFYAESTGAQHRLLIVAPRAPAPPDGYRVIWMLDGDASLPLALPFLPPQADGALILGLAYPSGLAFDRDRRARDYTPEPDAQTGDLLSQGFGGAADFRAMLCDELRPWLAAHYPMNPQAQTLFGFSYGGLFVLDTLLTRPEAFDRYWGASPSVWFSQGQILRRLQARQATGRPLLHPALTSPRRVVLSVGCEEEFPTTALSPARRAHLQGRAMVSGLASLAAPLRGLRLADGRPALDLQHLALPGRDHHDMLMQGARGLAAFALAD